MSLTACAACLIVSVPHPTEGMYELTRDNRTVSALTVNAVEQLFLYPELVTSFLYRVTGSQVSHDVGVRIASFLRILCPCKMNAILK